MYVFRNNARLSSLDVFRGLTIAAMILVNNAEGITYAQLDHALWHGWTFTDTIFPFFLWIVGVSIVLSFRHGINILNIIGRTFVLFCIGLFLNAFPYVQPTVLRIPGILQRIAICYLIASLIAARFKTRGVIVWMFFILASYWAALKLIPVPGYGSGVLDRQGNLVQFIDIHILKGHLYSSNWDPEGIFSTMPAVASTLFGVIAGNLLKNRAHITRLFLATGVALIAIGQCMNIWLPINKNLWTSSYAVFMAGLAYVIYGIVYYVVEVRKIRRCIFPFIVFGRNPITVYVLSVIFTKWLQAASIGNTSLWNMMYGIYDSIIPGPNSTVIFALTHVLILYAVAYFLYKMHWFIKI